MSDSQSAVAQRHQADPRLTGWAMSAGLATALVWAYWPTIVSLFKDWQRDANYSVGQLVPLAAIYLLWGDRHMLRRCRPRTCWWGAALIVFAQCVRGFGLIWLFESAQRYAMVLTILGVVLLVAGREVFGRVRWILLFLFLMVPLPGKVHNLISGPLQGQATTGAVFTLELLGITVAREGHVIVLNDSVPLAVAEACSGLRMLTAFVVVAATLGYVIQRPFWQKCVIVCSSVPVAIFCNTIRLVVTALLFLKTNNEFAERFFHDFAGLTMMPLAVFILIVEMWLMSKLVIPEDPDRNTEPKWHLAKNRSNP